MGSFIGALAKILAAFVDLPKWWARWRERRKDQKIERLEVAIAKKDANVEVEHLQQQYADEQAKTTKEVTDEAKTKSLSDIAKYFRTPS